MDKNTHIKLLLSAELQYKYALALYNTYLLKEYPSLQYHSYFASQKHWADANELQLTADDEKRAAMLLDHSAVHLIATQLDRALEDVIPNRFNDSDTQIQNIAWVVRLIRNAFAHNPFAPVWLIHRECKNKKLLINGIKFMDTTGLGNKPMVRRDYGGPLALLWLSKYTRETLLK